MRMKTTAAALAVVILAAAVLGGCREEDKQTALQRFSERTADLAPAALEDTLRSYLGGGAPNSTYAAFLLGNHFYDQASDTASAAGWDNASAKVLLDSAEVYFGRAVAQDSTFIEPMVNLGSVWDDRSQMRGTREERNTSLAQAERFYQMALAVAPADEKARCDLGGLYLRQRRTQDALDQFQAVLKENPESALAHYNLAIMFAEQKIYREALHEWEIAAKNDPDGDIGQRSRENVRIVKDLMSAPDPEAAGH